MRLSSSLPGAEVGVDNFLSMIKKDLFAMRYFCDSQALRHQTTLSGFQAGPVDLVVYRGAGEQWGGRDYRLIQVDHADYFVVSAPLGARLTVRQNGQQIDLRRGQFTIVATQRSFSARVRSDTGGDIFSCLHVRIPGPMLRQRFPSLDEVCGEEMRVLPGSSSFMMSMFELALNDGPHLPEPERVRLGDFLFEAVTSVAASQIERRPPIAGRLPATHRTYERACDYVAARLSDPQLSPDRIAAHCGVSNSFLHASFAACSEHSVAQYIRERRLAGSRQALLDPKLRHRSILGIAADWGFDDPSHFSRLYKQRFGKTPREERNARSADFEATATV